jgi:hypothetical protein
MYQLILQRDNVISMWIEPGKKVGDAFWVRTREQAQQLLDSGIAAWPKSAATEVQEFGGPQERKSFANRTDGPSTGLLSSNALGLIKPSRV